MSNTDGLYVPNMIRTFSGIYIDVLDPKPYQIKIIDIAHALSQSPRFGGHLPYFYSVAQHSIFCADSVDRPFKLEALLHDATEAYLTDIPSPIKSRLPSYIDLENNLGKVIAERFGLGWPISPEVKAIDRYALEFEYEYIFKNEKGRAMDMQAIAQLFINKYFDYGGH